jgi:DNA-binding NarL/FixJ family response regulator
VIRVLVVDDQDLVRDGIRAVLEPCPDLVVVGEAGDGAAALRMAAELAPDVVLLDIRMPGMDGLEATGRLLALPRPPRVLVVTTFDLDEYVVQALRSGASGFLLKDVQRDRLVDAVRAVAAGETLLAPSVTRRLVEAYVARPRARRTPSPLAVLSPRERDVLRLVSQGNSNAEIAATLYLGETTVKSYVSSALMKLGLRDRVHAVIFAYESGLIDELVGEAQPR